MSERREKFEPSEDDIRVSPFDSETTWEETGLNPGRLQLSSRRGHCAAIAGDYGRPMGIDDFQSQLRAAR
jgi:hypothetical protein